MSLPAIIAIVSGCALVALLGVGLAWACGWIGATDPSALEIPNPRKKGRR